MRRNHKINNYSKSLSLDKNLKLISKNKDLENLIQDINNINNNIIRYNQIENLLRSDIKYDNEKEPDIINLQKYLEINEYKQNNLKGEEKQKLFGDFKQLCNKVYSPKKTIETENSINKNFCVQNIKPYKNSIKEAMNSIFKRNEIRIRNKFFPLKQIKNSNKKNILKLNLDLQNKLFDDSNNISSEKEKKYKYESETDRVINDYNSKKYQNNYYIPRTIETDRRINISYGNYASNHAKFKHPQFYILNSNKTPIKKNLPPIKNEKLKMVDLLRKNNSQFNIILNQKENKFAKYYLAMRMGEIYKFKVT
jgi:hypothetical protein